MSGTISQFFVLAPRGETIINRDFRGDVPKNTPEIFFRQQKFFKGKQQEAPPIFHNENVSFLWTKVNGLYFLVTTRRNVSPCLVMELLTRCTKVFKDYCGVLNEESIRKNFVLIYELLDEIIDFGYPQGTSTELLKSFVFNEPIAVDKPKKKGLRLAMDSKTTPSTSVDKPIAVDRGSRKKGGKKQKNEIFVDIYERISVTFNSNGFALSSAIDGTIQMKSYLSGNPPLKLALNEDLVVGKTSGASHYGAVTLDDCNFHECVQLDDFEGNRTLSFVPPDGEFAVMNYRITGEFRCPFRIFPFFDLVTPYQVELIVKVRADIPESNYGGNVVIQFDVPKATNSVVSELPPGSAGQAAEYDPSSRKVTWKIKKFRGGTELTLRAKIVLAQSSTAVVRKEIGPISMQFEIPMYNVSNLQVRYLRIMENHKGYSPYRWVRYVTRSSSYICRL